MACCYRRSVLMQMYPETEGCKCCHFKLRRDRVRGLPVNTGYAKTRQHLREKLKREKTQAHQQTQQGQQVAAGAGPIEKKKPANETVTTNEHPNGTMDVDELVENIEGLNIDKKGDPKKKAKRARQKEKKEQTQKALEEQAKAEAEEKRKAEEAEQLLREEAEREEEARKKREKKKKRKKKGKEETQASQPEGFAKTESAGGIAARAANSILKPNLLTGPQGALTVASSSAEPPVPRKSSEMVTIRRHSTAPDTTVTISVKSETGDEDLLYTLVNGQVLPSNGKTGYERSLSNDTSSIKSASTTACNGTGTSETSTSKNKKKKKKKKAATAKSETSQSEASDSGSSSDESELMPPPGAGVYNQDSNMIVMNPDYNDEDDELAGYNSDDYYYGRKQPAKFEEVVSSKTKRQRSKANKTEEKEEEKTFNGSGDLKPHRETTPGGANSQGNKGKRRADTGPRGNNNTSAEKSRKGSKVSNKSAGSPAFTSNKTRTGPSASTSNMAPRHIKARAEAHQQQQMAQKALQMGASASSVRAQTSDQVAPPLNSWVRSTTGFDYSHLEKAASTTPDSQSSGGFALYTDSSNPPTLREEFQFSNSNVPVFPSQSASSASAMNCVGADGTNYPFGSSYSKRRDPGSDLGPLGRVEYEMSPWNREDIEFLNSHEQPEFSAAVSRPATRPSPSQQHGLPFNVPGPDLASLVNAYYGKEKPSSSSNSWGWNDNTGTQTPPRTSYSPYPTDLYQPPARFSPTRPPTSYNQSSPLLQAGIRDEPRLFSLGQTMPTNLMNQTSFEPTALSSNLRNITRPEPTPGNDYLYPTSNPPYHPSPNMFGTSEIERVARNPNRTRPTTHESAFGAAAQNYQANQRRYIPPTEPPYATRNDYGNYGNYNSSAEPLSVQSRARFDVDILRTTEQLVNNRQKTLSQSRAGELCGPEEWNAFTSLGPAAGRLPAEFLPPQSSSSTSSAAPFSADSGFMTQGAVTDRGEARLRDLSRPMYGELGPFVNLRNNAEGRAPAPNNQPEPQARNEYSLF